MAEYLELQPIEEVDAALAEMESFNDLVEQIDAIPVELQEQLRDETSYAKLGGPADKTGFGHS